MVFEFQINTPTLYQFIVDNKISSCNNECNFPVEYHTLMTTSDSMQIMFLDYFKAFKNFEHINRSTQIRIYNINRLRGYNIDIPFEQIYFNYLKLKKARLQCLVKNSLLNSEAVIKLNSRGFNSQGFPRYSKFIDHKLDLKISEAELLYQENNEFFTLNMISKN